MSGRSSIAAGLVLAALALPSLARAAEAAGGRKSPFSFEASAGLQYDTNVSVPEIDTASSQGDFAALLDADVGYRTPVGCDSELDLSYRFAQSLHDDFPEFDIQSHSASADLSHDFGDFDAGVGGRFIELRLDDNPYLQMTQFSPWASKFFARRVFVRAEYAFTEKDFDEIAPRDAQQHAAGADAYWFFAGARRYLMAGYRYRYEDAADAQFDYRSHSLKLRLSQRFRVMEHAARARIGWVYEARDYRSITPLIGTRRDDDRHRLQADVELELGKRSFARLEYEYGNYDSDLYTVDYTQQVVSLSLGLRI